MSVSLVKKFVEAWNSGSLLPVLTKQLVEDHAYNTSESLIKQFDRFVYEENRRTSVYRVSMMGYPAVEIAARKLAMEENLPLTTRIPYSKQWIFHLGDYFESLILTLMKANGLEVKLEQHEVTIKTPGKELKGHIDAIVGDVLIDVKTMSFFYFNSFIKDLDDERGYITQLSLYYEALKGTHCKSAGFLCLNKGTNQLAFVPLVEDARYVDRAIAICAVLPEIKSFEDIQNFFDIPPLVVEGHKRSLPKSMQYSEFKELFYEFDKRGPVRTAW